MAIGISRSDTLILAAPKEAAWIEVWSFKVSPTWRTRFDGPPAVLPERIAGDWTYEYHPRPGETLKVSVTRPTAVKGATLAIDQATLSAAVGKRASETDLTLSYRSTQGGRHLIALPADAQVSDVRMDDSVISVRPEKGELPLAVLPGSHRIHIHWQRTAGVGLLTRLPGVDLRTAGSNLNSVLRSPSDRWILMAGGSGVGPAILYWGELLVFIVLAVLLSRSVHSSLRMHEWLLLGLGLSTFSWAVLLLFTVWQFALRWREGVDAAAWSVRRYNALQVVMIALSVITVVSLVSAIPNGLLAVPDMRIAGWGQTSPR
ncbi:MAG: hypothetical protein U1F35_07495 [Steroidobacteraceae bacterium]